MNLLAALIFFTRLPLWKWKAVPAECFKHVVPYWPLVGWLTGGTLCAVLYSAAQVFPLPVAWLLALTARLLLTGCLHEDGLADFLDGFGGGTTRERTLAIMKDSHIGTYGVIGLVVYFLLLWQVGSHLPLAVLAPLSVCADCWSKAASAQLVNFLPYARTEAESKAKVVYSRMRPTEGGLVLLGGGLPVLLLLPGSCWMALLVPCGIVTILIRLMKRRIGGYTGDCCGATFLLSELGFYLVCGGLLLCS